MTDRRIVLKTSIASLLAGFSAGRVQAQGAGPVVLITGCSSGFGRLTALEFARAGYRTVASMRNLATDNAGPAEDLRAIAASEGLALKVVEIDVRDDASVSSGHAAAVAAYGPVEILVSNAGIGIPLPAGLSIPATQEVMETNFYGGLRMAHAVLPGMRAQNRGLIIQVTSALGRYTLPLYAAYCASKHALEAAFTALAYEMHPFGIETTLIQPGGYDTMFKENARRDVNRYLERISEDRQAPYSDHIDALENILREQRTPPPRQIARAILAVAEMPRGERPLHVAEGPGMSDLAPLNERLTDVTESSLRYYIDRPDWMDVDMG
mgnify:CR=1 FL=1